MGGERKSNDPGREEVGNKTREETKKVQPRSLSGTQELRLVKQAARTEKTTSVFASGAEKERLALGEGGSGSRRVIPIPRNFNLLRGTAELTYSTTPFISNWVLEG